ncbi:Polyphenol oxidase [Morus notabilis]|uniref:Polyphenol oxidase n=1 Tax=Morus notabilis TaxID=981085 RepID=W9RNN0_9ROSA|nr:Polyphenol oxidase [Morus notabilis]
MASFSLTHTINLIPSTAISTSCFPPSFLQNKSHIPNLRKQRKPISCKGSGEHDQSPIGKVDRRNMLIGLGGLYGTVAGLGSEPLAFANPVAPPDLSKCGPADFPPGAIPTNCCPPVSTVQDYQLPSVTKLRVRPPAHAVDEEYIAKYSRAVELMKALPDSDPRSFTQQADIHCAYCNGSYDQVGFPNLELQIHSSWLFFPFHRWYLYFYERILGKLIGDPTFALPFWNYDAPPGMQLPALYVNVYSPLYDKLREATHQPPTIIDLDYSTADIGVPPSSSQVSTNLCIMYRQMISCGKNPRLFYGEPYREGDDPNPGAGTIETVPHNSVHLWPG